MLRSFNGPGWIQTSVGSRQRVYSPLRENSKSSQKTDLQKTRLKAYKPAYKRDPKSAEIHGPKAVADLQEIVAVWPDVPHYIKAAIMSLVKSCTGPED
jgi:hypothetical protein